MSDFEAEKGGASSLAHRNKWRLLVAVPAIAGTAALLMAVAFFGLFGDDASSNISSSEAAPALQANNPGASSAEASKVEVSSGIILVESETSIVYPDDPAGDFNFGAVLEHTFEAAGSVTTERWDDAGLAAGEQITVQIGDHIYVNVDGDLLAEPKSEFASGNLVWPEEPGKFVQLSAPSPENKWYFNGDQWYFNPAFSQPDLALALIKDADDFKQVSTGDGETTSSGTFKAEALEKLDPSELPAGLSNAVKTYSHDMLYGNADSARMGVVELQITAAGEELRTLTSTLTFDTSTKVETNVWTATFSEFGEPQEISAPAAELVIAEEDLPVRGLAPGESESDKDEIAIAILDDFKKAEPSTCQAEWRAIKEIDEELVGLDGYGPGYQEKVLPLLMARIDCLGKTGNSDVADAARQVLPEDTGKTYLATAEEYLDNGDG